MIKLHKKNIKIIIPISAIIIILLIVLTLSIKNNDMTKLTKISKEIVTINTSLNTAIKDDGFDYPKACEVLKNNLELFNNVNSELQSIKLKKTTSEEMKQALSDYINSNVVLYNSALDILNNQELENFSNLYKSLVQNEKTILKTSNDLSNSSLNIYFPKSANTFFVGLNNYINTLYKSNRDNEILNSQKLDFLLYINGVFSDFSGLKEDVHDALVKIREDKRDLSVLLDDINNKRSIFSEVKNKSYSISIPSGAQDCYSALEEMLNSYEVYLNSLETSVKSEIAFSKGNNNSKTSMTLFENYKSSDDIDNSYADTFDKYSTFISSFESLENTVSDYKNK